MKAFEAAITPKTKMVVLNTPHNPIGKVFDIDELKAIGDMAIKYNLIILSDEVYDRLFYVPFKRIATLPGLYERTLTVGSAGKNFYATGWRVGYLIGPPHLIHYVAAAHTRICYSSVSPLQEASAIAFEEADKHNFWDESKAEMKGKMEKFNTIWDELGIPVRPQIAPIFLLLLLTRVAVLHPGRRILCAREFGQGPTSFGLRVPATCCGTAA